MRRHLLAAGIAALIAMGASSVMAETEKPSGGDELRLPKNYRDLIAKFALMDYSRSALGNPQISEKRNGRTVEFCIQYTIKKMSILFEETTGTQTRALRTTLTRNMFGTLKVTQYTGANFDPCAGPMRPFPELAQQGKVIKDCRAKNGLVDCGVDGFTFPRATRELEKAP